MTHSKTLAAAASPSAPVNAWLVLGHVKMARVVLLHVLTLVTGCIAESNYSLYFASQGWSHGEDHYKGGLYGGEADVNDNGNSVNLTATHVECFLSAPNHIKEDNLKTRGISFDKLDNEVLFHLYDERRLLVYTFPRCQDHPHHELCDPEKVLDTDKSQGRTIFSYAITTHNYEECPTKALAFALYNHYPYFVVKRAIKRPAEQQEFVITIAIEIRKVAGCEFDLFHSQKPFNMDGCSIHLATLLNTTLDRCDSVFTGNSLLILQDPENFRLHYFTQVFNKTDTTFSITLFEAYKRGPIRALHTTYLPYSYHEITEDGRHLGTVTYKDGKLCWSAVNQILCGDWSFDKYLQNVEVVLQPGKAAEAGICFNGPNSHPDYANITTGVAIAEWNEEDGLSLFFGCQQEEPGQGGAGLLRRYPGTGSSLLFPLTENYKKVYAGGMFLAERCDLLVSGSGVLKFLSLTTLLLINLGFLVMF